MSTKKKSTMKSAGKNKAAVMNSRSPKKPMAISGDTMNSGSMYKKGGRVKKSLTKAQAGKQTGKKVDLGNDMSLSNNVQSFFKDPSVKNAVRTAMVVNPITQGARAVVEGGFRTAAALGSKKAQEQVNKIDSTYNANQAALSKQKKGGKVKKYATGGTSPSDSTAIKRMAAIGMVPDPSKPGLYMKDTKKTMVSKKMGGKASSKKMYGGMKKGGTKKGM
jgi:hypothetical protein